MQLQESFCPFSSELPYRDEDYDEFSYDFSNLPEGNDDEE